jgi:transposase InsO family protein
MKALQEQGYRIGDLCAAFGVSRSGYHRARTAAPSARVRKDAQLAAQLRELHRQSRGTYGRPRLTRALRQGGWRHSPKRVARLLRSLGLRGVQRGRFRPQTTDSRHEQGIAPNRLQDQAPPAAPDQIWVADITYIPTTEGWLYVAGVLDRCSRRVLGLAMAARLDTSLPEAALRQALARRGRPRDVIHHSDRGIQYTSARYRQILQQHRCEASMSRRANCYDNAHMESFWGTLKAELLAGRTFATRAAARLAIFEYVEIFYNRTRLHSALGYLSPVDFETKLN